MLRSLPLLGLLLVLVAPARAQDEPAPLTEADGWRTAATAQLAGSQAAYSNWQEGGVSTLAFTASTNGVFERILGAFKQKHEARFAFGLLKQDSLDFRKAEDLIRYAFALQYRGFGVVQPTLTLVARTQFAAGFDYSPTAEEYPTLPIVAGQALKVSGFGAPAYLTQTLGITYDPDRWYTARIGLGIKETLDGSGSVREALKDEASALEEGKADILGLYMITELHKAGELGDVDLRDYYTTFMTSVFRSIRFGAASAHGKSNMVRFNFFLEQDAFVRDATTGRYRVDYTKMEAAMNKLSRLLLTLQGDGDYDGAAKLTNGKGVISAQLQADLDRLTKANIPVDITFKQGAEVLGIR